MKVLKFIRTHDDPCVTASEVAEQFGITNEAANYHLKNLQHADEIEGKVAGSAAKVWYAVG